MKESNDDNRWRPGVTQAEANAPQPTRPEGYAPLWIWENYWNDLACWKATQAERLMGGIVDDKKGLK